MMLLNCGVVEVEDDKVNVSLKKDSVDDAEGLFELIQDFVHLRGKDQKRASDEAYAQKIVKLEKSLNDWREYVDDTKTGRKVPTCHLTLYTSIFEDADYKSAIRYSDVVSRDLYEEEARTIAKIQVAILEISAKEEPFDIFICYKETDQGGNRTEDSVLAFDIHRTLTKEGYKVFYSKITLEDKLGSE